MRANPVHPVLGYFRQRVPPELYLSSCRPMMALRLSATDVRAFGESFPKRAQALLARGGQRTLLVERQRQGTHVGVAAGERDDLSVQVHEPVEGGGGGGEARPRRGRGEGREHFRALSGRRLRGRHPLLHARHHRIVGVGDVGACSAWITVATAFATSALTCHVS